MTRTGRALVELCAGGSGWSFIGSAKATEIRAIDIANKVAANRTSNIQASHGFGASTLDKVEGSTNWEKVAAP
jgi:hypothetical protein